MVKTISEPRAHESTQAANRHKDGVLDTGDMGITAVIGMRHRIELTNLRSSSKSALGLGVLGGRDNFIRPDIAYPWRETD